MQDNRILSTLKSSDATLAVLVLALVAQTPHAADVFRLIVHSSGIAATLHSYAFAIALELAVLLFVVQGRHRESYAFAGVSIAMNLSYYALHGVHLIAVDAMPALLVSFALPVAIARYSHAVADAPPVQSVQPIAIPVQDPPAPPIAIVQETCSEPAVNLQDAQPDLHERIAALRSEGLDDKHIATRELPAVPNAVLASALGKNATTVYRWRNATKEIA